MVIISFVHYLFLFYTVLLFVRILGSWIPELQGQRWMFWVASYTDPYLHFFRRIIPPLGMMDFSPVIAFIALRIAEQYVVLPFVYFLLGYR